jgi:hypothetical protein
MGLPKNPKKGSMHTTICKSGRRMTFQATGKKGFAAWKIVGKKKP